MLKQDLQPCFQAKLTLQQVKWLTFAQITQVFTFSIKCSRNLTNYQVESGFRLNSETMQSGLLYNLPGFLVLPIFF